MFLFTAWIVTVVAVLLAGIIACLYAALKLGMGLMLLLVAWLSICLILSVHPLLDDKR